MIIKDLLKTIFNVLNSIKELSENLLIRESFDANDLNNGVYTVNYETNKTQMGIGIYNNSTENSIILTINGIDIVIPSEKYFTGLFEPFTTVTVSGTSLNFNAFIVG